MKRLFTLLLISFAALSCEMIDEKLDDFLGRDDSSVTTIANNQIWYTSTDGEIVEPYSGEYNNNADALTTFGVNIVSNTYVDGKGVIEFDGDVTTIGERAFDSCSSLTSVTIPDSVTAIGEWAFCGCDSLESVTIPDSVTEIGGFAFLSCVSLTSVTIGDSVTTIGGWAFEYCSSLRSVTIGDSVTTIGMATFGNCSSLTSVTIPDSVTTIGMDAFYGCRCLQEFKGKFASEDGRCLIFDGLLNAFAIGCGATEYTIPDSVTTIGNDAFAECYSLTSVTIPDSVTTIGICAFLSCSSLTSVTIPDSVTTIGTCAFYGCSSLESVTICDSVTEIGDVAFSNCVSLTSVYCKATIPPAGGDYMFSYNASGRKIYVPMESVEAYKSAYGWSDYVDDIVGYNF